MRTLQLSDIAVGTEHIAENGKARITGLTIAGRTLGEVDAADLMAEIYRRPPVKEPSGGVSLTTLPGLQQLTIENEEE